MYSPGDMDVFTRKYGCVLSVYGFVHKEIPMCSSGDIAVCINIFGLIYQEICMCSTGDMAVDICTPGGMAVFIRRYGCSHR
jgi:hypothetical protein